MGLNWDLVNLAGSIVVQNLIIGTLIIATPKRSPYRYLSVIFLIWNASRFVHPLDLTTYGRNIAIGNLFVAVFTALHLLLINPLDERDLAREMPTTFFRSGHFYYVFEIISMTRGVKTPRQVKNLPAHPKYFDRYEGKIPVGPYLLRQMAILTWQFLAIDIIQVASIQAAPLEPGFKDIEFNLSLEKWTERLITNLITWFFVARILIDSSFKLASVIFVGLGLDEPKNWPPVFGRMKDSYTLRNYWSKFWHQMLRQPFTSISNFIARDVLHLPRPSILERYTNTFIVFFASGTMHYAIDLASGVPWELSGAMYYFLSFVLGIMIEDGVQALWKRFSPPEKSADGEIVTPLWKKVVGMLWVGAWIGVFSAPYTERMAQLPPTAFVPFSVVEKLGLEVAGGAAGVGALLLWFTVSPEL